MSRPREVDLAALLAAVVADLQAGFPALVTVEEYSDDHIEERRLPVPPAALVDLMELEPEPEEDPGTGQTPVSIRFEVSLVISFSEQNAERSVRVLAAAVAHRIAGSRFGQPIGRAQIVAVEPQSFAPELDQYVAWRVEWFHKPAYLGPLEWPLEGTPVTKVHVGREPDTGPGNELEYEYFEGEA